MKAEINLMAKTDILISGATLYGCYLSWYLAQKGNHVTIVTSGASLGTDITRHYSSWFEESQIAAIPEPFQSIISKSVGHEWRGEKILNINKLACELEDLLIENHIDFFYQARPAALLKQGDELKGLIVGGKFGLNAMPARVIIDTSTDGTLAKLDGCAFEEMHHKPIVRYRTISNKVVSADLDGMTFESADFSCSLATHDYYVDYQFTFSTDLHQMYNSEIMVEIQRALLEVNKEVLDKTKCSLDIFLPCDVFAMTPRRRIRGSGNHGVESYVSEISSNLLILGPASADETMNELSFQVDVLQSLRYVSTIAADLKDYCQLQLINASELSIDSLRIEQGEISTPVKGQFSFTDSQFSEPGVEKIDVEFAGCEQWFSSDVLVIGGGTSGFPCAIELSKMGVDVACLEMHAYLGGTNTVGGVSRYWYGFWNPYLENYLTEIKDTTETHDIPVLLGKSDIALKYGLKYLPNVPICGVVSEGDKIKGVCVITENGISVLSANYFIDATGDGDIAAWAGNDYWFGMGRDESTLFYSYGKFRHGDPEVPRHFNSILDVRSLRDYTRCVVVGRRQYIDESDNEYPQFYVAPRESRHIACLEKVTYVDMLMNRAYDDTIAVCRSDVDIKGFSASDAAMIGFIEPDYYRAWDCSMPYGAIVPRNISNLLIAGKSYSITHDALGMCRMQPDMISMGAAVAHATRLAISSNVDFHHLDTGELQEVLVNQGLLIKPYIENTYGRTIPTDREMRILAERFFMGPLEMNEKARILSNKDACVKYMSEAIKRNSKSSIESMAVMLCYHRSKGGVEVLLNRLEEVLQQNELPQITNIKIIRSMPDMGHAPPPAFWIAAVGLTGDERLIPLIERFVDKLNLDPNHFDYRNTYVIAIAHALERIASKKAIPALMKLTEHPAMANRSLHMYDDMRKSSDFIAERYSYAHLWLSRALARCGSAAGYTNLIDYLDSLAVFLCRSSHKELKELTGQDFGFDKKEWLMWVDRNKTSIVEQPYVGVIE